MQMQVYPFFLIARPQQKMPHLAHLDHDPVGADAGLPRVPEGGPYHSCGRLLYIGIVKDNEGGVATQLQGNLQEAASCGRGFCDSSAGNGMRADDRRQCAWKLQQKAIQPVCRPRPTAFL